MNGLQTTSTLEKMVQKTGPKRLKLMKKRASKVYPALVESWLVCKREEMESAKTSPNPEQDMFKLAMEDMRKAAEKWVANMNLA